MAGRRIGEVFVAVEADTSMFRTSATTGLKRALAGLEGKIPITADTAQARAQVAALKARMTDLSRVLSEIKIGANGKPAEAEIRKLQLQLADLANMTSHVTMEADTSKLDADIDREELRLAKLNLEASHLNMDADDKKFKAKLAADQYNVDRLSAQLRNLLMEADTSKLDADVAKEKLNLAKLNEEASTLKMDADDKQLKSKIAAGVYDVERLNGIMSSLELGIDDKQIAALHAKIKFISADIEVMKGEARHIVLDANADRLLTAIGRSEAAIAGMRAEAADIQLGRENLAKVLTAQIASAEADLAVLKSDARNIVLDANAERLLTAIGRSEASIAAMKAQAADLKLGGKTDLAALAGIELRLLGLEGATKRLNPDLDVMNDKLIKGARNFGRFGLGALTARVALFGGLSAVSGWHIALDLIIESLAVIVPALTVLGAGLAAFALAGADAFRQVYQRLLNIHTVSDAFGVTIGPMTGKLEKLHQVVRPQVWQLYGDAIAIAHNKTDLFGKLAVSTGAVIDKFAGRLTVLATQSGPGLTKFIASGTRDLKQFGRIFLNLGDAFGKLIQVTEKTHIAEALLAIVNAGAKLVDLFTKLPLPILATVVAIHGIYLWSGLAATAMTALLRPFSRMAAAAAGAKLAGSAMQDLANTGGGTRFSRLGAVFSDLGTNLKALPGRVKSLATEFKNLVTKNWQVVVAGVVIAGLVTIGIWLSRTKSRAQELIGQIDQLGKAATVFNVFNNLGAQLILTNKGLATAQKDLNTRLKEGSFLAPAMAARFGPLGSGAQEAADRVDALTGKNKELQGTLLTVTGRLAGVAGAYGTKGLSGAIALANIAGVKINQLLSTQKDVWAGALQQIDGVVQGYANMGQGSTQLANDISVLTIAQSDQLKNVQALNSAFDTFTGIVSGPVDSFLSLANTLKRFGKDSQVAGAQITGLGSGITGVSKKATDASLQLQTDFQDTFKAATQMADAFRLTGTASAKQVSAIKDVVQVLIPMAGSNKAAAAEISALAQEAGGPATTNLKELAKWAGKTKDPLGKAQKAAQDAAVGFSNMSLDAQKLGTTLSQDLTKDMATAVENAVGLQGAMNKFAKDLQNGTDVTAAGHKDRAALVADLAAVGITGKPADAIINALTDRLAGHRKALAAGAAARAVFNADLNAILIRAPGAKSDVQKLADAVKNHGAKSDEAKAARKKLIDDLVASGTSSKNAKILVDKLQTSISNMHGKTVTVGVNFVGSGTGQIAFKESIPGVTLGPSSKGLLGFHAKGGKITGGTLGKDSVLGMLMPGEVVVPTKMVQEGAVDHLRGRLPGFASGGAVGGVPGQAGVNNVTGIGNRMFSSGSSFMEKAESQFGKAVEQAFYNMVLKKFKKDMETGSGPAVLAYAEQFLHKVPYVWGGSSPAGWDCSGFVSYVYDHFKLFSGRSDAAGLQRWAKASSPTPGGMAFYGTPAHHVGFVVNGNTLLSALNHASGTTLSSLNLGDNSGYGIPPRGFGVAGGAPGGGLPKGKLQELAFSLLNQYGWGNQWASFNALENREAGWSMTARNPSSGAYGLAQFINGPSEYFQYGGNPNTGLGQLTGMFNYIAQRYGSPNAAWAHEVADNWYGSGGLVPGYAAGGSVTDPGGAGAITALRAKLWSLRHHEGVDYLGLLNAFKKGPSKYRTKLTMQELTTLGNRQGATQKAYTALTGKGLTKGNLDKFGSAARAESRVASDKFLNRVPGGHPGWASGLRHWLGEISKQAAKGLPGGQTSTGPGGVGLPAITHTYGGDVGNAIGAFLGSVASPFGKAAGGLVFDRGGWLKPGWNATYNGTGKAEHLVPSGQDVTVHIDVSGANSDAEKFLATMIKKYVKIRGGNVQTAYGTH